MEDKDQSRIFHKIIMSPQPTNQERLELAFALALSRSRSSLQGYLDSVVIDSRPDPRLFREVSRPWQQERAARLGPPLESIMGFRPPWIGPRCFWDTMPRGYDKTTGIARLCNWLLAFSKRPLEIDAAAGDEEQAHLLKESMQREADLNPWLGSRLKFGTKRVFGVATGSVLKVLTADAFSSFGLRPDVIVVDEITHWKKRDLWDALWSAYAKMPGCVVFVLTNAGLLGSWQEDLKLAAQADTATWKVFEAPGPPHKLPTWMRPEDEEAIRRMLPPATARRIIDNEWIDPAEESGYLTRQDVQGCEERGREMGLGFQVKGKPGEEYTCVIDYGPKRDRTALGTLHQREDGLVIVDRLEVWEGKNFDSGEVPLLAVRDWIEQMRKDFGQVHLVMDPHQMLDIAQYYEHHLPVLRYEARGGKGNYVMAEVLRSAVVNRQVVWYPGAGTIPIEGGKIETLADELTGLVLRPMPYGYRFDHTATKHDDRSVVLGMGLVAILHQLLPSRMGKVPKVVAPVEKDITYIPGIKIPRQPSSPLGGLYGLR